MVCYDIANQDQMSKIGFQTARQSQIDFKMANRSKYCHRIPNMGVYQENFDG